MFYSPLNAESEDEKIIYIGEVNSTFEYDLYIRKIYGGIILSVKALSSSGYSIYSISFREYEYTSRWRELSIDIK